VKRSLQVSNPNSQPVAFKVKTTAPKQYCVRPNSGRIEPGEKVEVQGECCSWSIDERGALERRVQPCGGERSLVARLGRRITAPFVRHALYLAALTALLQSCCSR
jgi:hypothetical protein